MPRQFRFTAGWDHPAEPGRVVEALADIGAYPQWWPQVRAVRRLDERTVRAVCRSFLPFTLDLVLTQVVEDRVAGLLEADIGGDLTGWSRWTLEAYAGGTRLGYEQEVDVASPGLARAARHLGPLLEANHAWMMRGARRGLLRQVPGPDGGTGR